MNKEENYLNVFVRKIKNKNEEKKEKEDLKNQIKSKEKIKLIKLYSYTIPKFEKYDLKKGRIFKIKDKIILIDIGFKYDCILSKNELQILTIPPRINELIDVIVEKLDYKGKCFLSYRKANKIKSWHRINDAYRRNELVSFLVLSRTKGGLIVSLYNIECFLPGSQIEYKKVTNFDYYVGKILIGKIVKLNKTTKNIVVSHKIIIEKKNIKRKALIISNLNKGIIVEGVVKNITNYGCFVDLGCSLDGLCHISDISWKRIKHPVEKINLGERRNFLILSVDRHRKRVQLGIKQMIIDNCKRGIKKIFVYGKIIKVKIKVFRKFGILVEIYPGFEGLLHKKEELKFHYKIYPKKMFKIGNAINVLILGSKLKHKKISFSFKII
ncbi:S1 RNA-binding domain-containing protein [Candidatus Karelsulcia muelleri]